MVGEQSKLRCSGYDIAIRDDKRFGEVLNKGIPDVVDCTKWECYGFVDKNDKPIVAWCYHSYLGNGSHRYQYYEAEMSIVALNKRWATKNRINQMLTLFFKRNGYNRLTALIKKSNWQAVKLVKLAGFTLEGIIRQPANIEEILQFSILKEDWQRGCFYGENN